MSSPFLSAGNGGDLGTSYGVMLVSTVGTAVLYGFTVLQALYYFGKFPQDSRWLKAAVGITTGMDGVTVILDTHMVYYYLILNYNNPPALETEVLSAQIELLLTYTVVLVVQLFFITRMWHLRPHWWWIPAILGVLAVASWVMIIAIFARVVHDTKWTDTDRPSVTRPLAVNWVLGMIVDVAITVVLCWYLWSDKQMVRHKTNVMLNRIIVFLVNRAAIAAIVQVLTLVTKVGLPNTLIWIAFHNILSKVYANSMLATLNARMSLRKIAMETELEQTPPPHPSRFSAAPGGPPGLNSSGYSADRHAPLQFAHNLALHTSGTTTMDVYDYTGPYSHVPHSSGRGGPGLSQKPENEDSDAKPESIV
ncbi:uncharacterized protein BXZ73DRAFT_103617 [Epithele typhae]|uniref:uncharacterized protein n=1 Tax=Epithele typhae TaxID=378194 RepID=UPI002007F2EB|nr:uncharacterized protein BXZ73DRAFT_103617 [Epithele typhae]KAH9924326.1 hypothetical protein BXZ73DRAFT_103617 [Epithele typhae]